jgi:acetylornithine deacetylase
VREMHSGVNAIDGAVVVMERFRAYETKMNRAELRHPAFAVENHPININIGTLQGGEWNSSVATRAKLGVRVGVMPGRSCHEVRREIEALVAEAAADDRLRGARLEVAFQGFMADGCVFPPEQAISRAVAAAHRHITGKPVRHYTAPALTDARFYALHQGTEATCYGPDADSIHGIDESVDLDSMHDVTRVLALTIAEWCGTERGRSA